MIKQPKRPRDPNQLAKFIIDAATDGIPPVTTKQERAAKGGADGWLAAVVLTFAMGLTFASVQMGVAVMLLTARDDSGRGRRRPTRRPPAAARFGGSLTPAPVPARPPRG